jgi:pimeloyl-ACP methyl ester carboxylesterase
MKKWLRRLGKIVGVILSVLVIFLVGTTIYHHIRLTIEIEKLVPNGMLVDVNGHKMHVYAEGENSEKPTLVFMSGSGTVAPVYDFKSLYAELSDTYRIAVVEKVGYGYSDLTGGARDIKTMLSETRNALSLAKEEGPYVLLPHSMSGIEALYWAQQYPEEIEGIIGLDMAVPESYDYFNFTSTNRLIKIGQATSWLGLIRALPGIYALNTASLTEQEIQQQKYLTYRNAVNTTYLLEGKAVTENAKIVSDGKLPNTPILLFVSDGKDLGDYWLPCQERFAKETNSELLYLDCGHYIHYYEQDFIAEKSSEFLEKLQFLK